MRNLNACTNENKENTITYVTVFRLAIEVPVNDANTYLQEDNMVDYLKDSVNDDKNNTIKSSDLVSITWAVANDGHYSDHGTIALVTTREFTEKELDFVSEYVKGQNSDGLGECFEQHFEYEETSNIDNYEDDEDEYGDGIGNDTFEMASFDWQTNDYKFKRNN